jgi:hypothetical protein
MVENGLQLAVFLPNLPFELTIGVWLMVKGIRDSSETKVTPGLGKIKA